MPHLEPIQATNLASNIYLVQDKRQAKTFFKLYKEILNTPLKPTSNTLSAEVGSRLINTKDSFGVCCHGSGQFKDNIFLIFRGSTTANMGADWISNARIGLEIGESSRPVHLGFNHIFKSMIPQLLTFFKNLPKDQPIHTVHCVGHSLGGAIATLAADWVKNLGSVGQVKCYTFGAPRPATHLFAKHFTPEFTIEVHSLIGMEKVVSW